MIERTTIKEIINTEYDVLVIGGGITGSCVLWDATLRGMKAILLEKNDYSSATSQATSKLIHGGLRYLKNLEIGLVRESLREKRVLAKISPHSFRPLAMMIPVYKRSEKLLTGIGMKLANLVSFDRNKGITSDLLIPCYIYLSDQNVIAEDAHVRRENLKGGYVYYDYSNFNPERLTCEFIFSARERGAKASNYTQVVSFEKEESGFFQVTIKDCLSDKNYRVKAKTIVNAGGPWADSIEKLTGVHSDKTLVRSKGIHLVTRKICADKTVVTKKKDGTHLFIIPWRGMSLIGTTDTNHKESPDRLGITKQEIQELINDVNFAYGNGTLQMEDVRYTYWGLRPLVQDSGNTSKETYSSSRKSEILDFKDFGYPGFFTAMGGKYTTSRHVAEQMVDKLAGYLSTSCKSCSTLDIPLIGGDYDTQISLIKTLVQKYPQEPAEKLEVLASRYGTETNCILTKYKPNFTITLSNGEKYYSQEMEYIIDREDITSLSDFLFRRSGIGNIGKPSDENLLQIVKLLGEKKHWDKKKIDEDIEQVVQRYSLPL
jgi:glycerol-3-phosphate dehydrogenase